MRWTALLLLFLAACASTPEGDIGSARSSWQGAAYEDIVRSWGAPTRSTKLPDGRDAHTWVSETVASRGSLWPSIGIFGGSGGVGFGTGVTMGPGGGELQRCERTLFFENGRVVDQNWQGSSDYCSSFRRG
ncbi:MAG TPA: hypothetical protein VED01_07395 [Burkholderiales bacterium]|nr:hypothetical protein [Burkholderiales bacterium]